MKTNVTFITNLIDTRVTWGEGSAQQLDIHIVCKTDN